MSVPYLVQKNLEGTTSLTPSYAAISGVSQTGRDVIEASQREHPEWYYNDFVEAVKSFPDVADDNSIPQVKKYTSAKQTVSGRLKPSTIDYLNADLAKHYGMSKGTAYQEALLNTAYQREVQDMKAAGLNPAVLYGAGRANGADTSLYPSESRSGGGGGRSSRRYGRSSSNGKLFSSSAYAAISAIGGLIGLGTTKNAGGYWIGSQTAKGAMGLLDAIWNGS